MAAHAISVMGVARGDDEFERLAVTSRELMQVERSFKGFSAQSFFQTVTIENLYRVAFIVLRMRKDERLDPKIKYEDFCDEWSVSPSDPDDIKRRMTLARKLADEGAGVEEIQAAVIAMVDDETAQGEADPTHPTA